MRIREVFPALAAVALIAACGGDEQSDLDREMDLAMAQDSIAQLADTAQQADASEPEPETAAPAERPRSRPSTSTPAPRPRTPAPAPDPRPSFVDRTIPAGAAVQVTLDARLSTRTSVVGDLVVTTVATDVMVGDGVAIPAGSQIRGRVTAVQKSGRPGEAAVLKIALDEVTVAGETYAGQFTVAEANPTSESRSSTGTKVRNIGIGAAAGAVLGQVIGKDTESTLIGAAIGAAAGTAIVLGSADSDAVLVEGSPMTLTVDAPITVRREV